MSPSRGLRRWPLTVSGTAVCALTGDCGLCPALAVHHGPALLYRLQGEAPPRPDVTKGGSRWFLHADPFPGHPLANPLPPPPAHPVRPGDLGHRDALEVGFGLGLQNRAEALLGNLGIKIYRRRERKHSPTPLQRVCGREGDERGTKGFEQGGRRELANVLSLQTHPCPLWL